MGRQVPLTFCPPDKVPDGDTLVSTELLSPTASARRPTLLRRRARAQSVIPNPSSMAGFTDRASNPSPDGTWSRLELFAGAVAFVIPLAYTSGLDTVTWSARAAILLVVAAVGLPLLVAQSSRGRPLPARSALAFVLVGCASAAVSQNRTTAVFGLYNQGTGLLFMAALAGAWAIGRGIRPQGRSLIERALLAGVLVNVVVALLSGVVDLPPSIAVNLVDAGGRASALTGNPVHLAELAVLGLALVIPRFLSSPLVWGVVVVAIAAAAQLSGTRLALVVMLGIVIFAGRRTGIRTAVSLGVLLVLGLAVGSAIGPSATSATGRSAGAASDGSLSVRPQTWLSARHAFAKYPVLGIGPGQFRTATSPYRPVSVARADGADALFTDAHNLIVEYATTTGFLGVTALIAWMVSALRRGYGCLLVGATAMVVIALFEPQSVVSTPLLFLALGASAADGRPAAVGGRRTVKAVAQTSCVVLSLFLAALFILGEFDLHQGQLDLRLPPIEQANRILPAWPRSASLLAKAWLFKGIAANHDPTDYQHGRSWRLVALHRDPADPALWDDLAALDAIDGRSALAGAEFSSALRLNPTSVRAMLGLATLAAGRCDLVQAAYWRQRVAGVSAPGAAPSNGPTSSQSLCTS